MSRSVDLLLSHGYFLADDPKEREIMTPYVPLGLLYISSWLRARTDLSVELFDSTFRRFDELEARLRQGPPAVLGLYANLMTRGRVVGLARIAKEAGWQVVLGGPEPANWAEEYLSASGADVIVDGEGEATMEELVPLLRASGGDPARLAAVAGIVFRGADGRLVRTAERAKIGDLDTIPWPDRESVDIDRYLAAWRGAHGAGSVSLITARGCPFRCNWCSHGVYGYSHRRRRPAAVAEEVAFLLDRYRPDQFWFADDVFNIRASWLVELANEFEARSLRIRFECICRADRMTEDVAATLARLGAFRVWIGSESGSQRILDAMERGVTVEEVRAATAALRRHGIESGMFLMWGYEGEEVEDIETTAEHVLLSNPDQVFTTVSYPIKGTGYWERVGGRVVPESADWASGSDREVRLRGRRSRRFYDAASGYLRSHVAAGRLWRNGRPDPRDLPALARAFVLSRAHRVRLGLFEHEVEA